MERGKDEVPGERSLHRDFGRLAIAHFAHHYQVGIVTQNGAQHIGKAHAGLAIDRNLRDPGNLVFHRIFHRHDFHTRLVAATEGGVESSCLARARGSGDEDQSRWTLDELGQLHLDPGMHA